MSHLVLSLLLSVSSLCWAQVEISPVESGAVHPGDVVEVQVFLTDKALFDALTPQKVKRLSLPEAFWFMAVNPWELRGDKMVMEARAVVGNKFTGHGTSAVTLDGQSITLEFRDWNFQGGAKQAPQPLEYQDLPWYSRAWIQKNWHWVGLIALGLTGFGWNIWRKKKAERERAVRLRQSRLSWLERIESARDIPSLSKIWESRDELHSVFEAHGSSLRDFFNVLNRYQFKPNPDSDDLQAVLVGKQRLQESLKAGANGI